MGSPIIELPTTKRLNNKRLNLLTITWPLRIQINTGNHQHPVIFGCKDDPNVLFVVGDAFQGIGLAPAIVLYLIVIDHSFFQYLFYLAFINMPAVHAAAGVFGIKDMAGAAVKAFIAIGVIAGWKHGGYRNLFIGLHGVCLGCCCSALV